MAIEQGFCEKHGPYDASLGGCPYCAQEGRLPAAPKPLDDEMPTDPWGGRGRQGTGAYEEEETDFGFRRRLYEEEEEVTQLPERRRLGRDLDETVVDVRERGEEGLLGFLIVREGMRRGKVYRVENGTTIGRDQANIMIRDPKVSRPHAKFTVDEDQFVIWDFGSENGTFVNDERIREAKPLQENDVIKVGDTVFVLKTLQ
jgi:hypothetical protein